MTRVALGGLLVLGLAACSSGGNSTSKRAAAPSTKAGTSATLAPGPKLRRHVELTKVDLPKGQQIEIRLHPDATRIRFRSDADGLLCPGLLSWPRAAKFKCIPAGGNRPISLPSVGTDRTHVGIAFAAALVAAQADEIAIDYVAVDPFFQVVTGAFGPGDLAVTFTPARSKLIGASVTDGGAPLQDGHVELVQGGRSLKLEDVADPGPLRATRSTSAAVVGRPVTARIVLDGPARALEMLLEWQ